MWLTAVQIESDESDVDFGKGGDAEDDEEDDGDASGGSEDDSIDSDEIDSASGT